jgi:hypothetical protein
LHRWTVRSLCQICLFDQDDWWWSSPLIFWDLRSSLYGVIVGIDSPWFDVLTFLGSQIFVSVSITRLFNTSWVLHKNARKNTIKMF